MSGFAVYCIVCRKI